MRSILKQIFSLAIILWFVCVVVNSTARAQDDQMPASLLLVLNKAENTLAIIEPTTLKILGRVPTGEGPHELVASPDGRTAYVANYGAQKPGSSLSVIDLVAKKELRRVDISPLLRPHGMVLAGGKVYFTCEVNRVVARFDPATNKVDWLMGTGQNATHMLAVAADQKLIYTANIASDSVTAFEFGSVPPAASKITQIAVGKKPEGIDLSPDAREVWVGHNEDGNISIIETATNKVKETIKAGQMPIRIKFTPDGKRVLVSDARAGEVVIFDAATRKELKRIAVGDVPVGIVVAPDSQRAFVAAIQSNSVVALDLTTLTMTGKVETGQGPDGLAWVGK